MTRVLALDIGKASIGVATSDIMRTIASPICAVKYEYENQAQFLDRLIELIDEYKPGDIVVGLPLNMDGTESSTTTYVKKVVELAKLKTNIPFHFVDERWTSKSAEKLIAQNNVKKTERKSKNDQVAAAIILQTFLESQI